MTSLAERASDRTQQMQRSPDIRTMSVGDFLLRRLHEAGIRHLFGVPGDFNLELLQQMEDTGDLKWVGTCNEMNASYAADGYARLTGMGALAVTNAVGALGAINGIAGAYAEHVPVILIAGSIPLRSIERGLGMHHTMGDGTWDRFLAAMAQVIAGQARLTPSNAAAEIDRLILTAWREKLPVYMEPPSDIAYLDVEVPAAPLVLAEPPATLNGSGRAPLRSPATCRRPSHRRSWWTETPTGTAPQRRSWGWPRDCRCRSR